MPPCLLPRARILLVGPTSPPVHGMTVFTEMLLGSSLAKRFRIVHLDTADRRNVGQMGRFDFWNVYLGLKHVCQMILLIVRYWPKIVYLPVAQNFWGYFRDAALLSTALFFRRKLIIHIHGGYFRTFYEESSRFMRWLIEAMMSRASRVIVLGECLRQIVPPCVVPDRVVVVPNGIDVPDEMPTRGALDGECTVAYLGTLFAEKGVVDTVQAAAILKRRGIKGVRFRFAGPWVDGDKTETDCRRIVEENDLKKVVEFIGVVRGTEKYQFLLDADIFVFPTYYPPEGQPQCILEAMAVGLPVISTDHGAIRETVIHERLGLLTEKMRPDRLAEAILRLVRNPGLRYNYSQAARERFAQEYTAARCTERLAQIFDMVLGKQVARRK